MSFGEEATNNKKPEPNPNQTRLSRQSVYITHQEYQQEQRPGKQVILGGRFEAEGDVTKEKWAISCLPLDPLAIAQSLKANLKRTWNPSPRPPQQHSPYRAANTLGSTRQPPAQGTSHSPDR